MASIYDIAKITSGDPLGAASEAGREASTLFAQYEHQKEIIDEINKAIKDAKGKSTKNKFGFGVGGSLLGGLLGTVLTPVLGPVAPYVGAFLGAGGAEKIRQDIKKPTEKLEKLKRKLSGRKIAEDVAQTTEVFEQGLDDMVLGDAIRGALSAAIMPGVFEKGKEATQTASTLGKFSQDLGPIATPGTALPATDDVLKIFGMESKVGDKFKVGQGQDILEALIGLDTRKMPWVGEALQNPWVVNLARAFGPSIYNELFKSKPIFDEYAQPQFRNPFKGGY